MVGDTATVSTLVTVEGQPYRPTFAGKGGFSRGLPCLPSKLSSSAVSSPVCMKQRKIAHLQQGMQNAIRGRKINDQWSAPLGRYDCCNLPPFLRKIDKSLVQQLALVWTRHIAGHSSNVAATVTCNVRCSNIAAAPRSQDKCLQEHLIGQHPARCIASILKSKETGGRTLTTNVGTGAIVHNDIKVHAAAASILANKAMFICLSNCTLQG